MLFKRKKHLIQKLKIAYLLEDTSLCGGVKIVFDHARMLAGMGMPVTIITRGTRPDYFELGQAEFVQIHQTFREAASLLLRFDIVIATYFQQVLDLHSLPVNLVHFSQGYEPDCPFWAEKAEEVKKAYELPVPKITVSKRVASLVREVFSQDVQFVPQGVDLALFSPKTPAVEIRKVIIPGIWENEIKGIRYAVEGFSLAKKLFPHLSLIRVSTLPLSDEEKSIYTPDEYHVAVPPNDMGSIYRQCDLAVVPSLEGEGFGLPAVEAMACGLPVILTKIQSFLSFHYTKDYAYFVSQKASGEIADAIACLCRNPGLAARLSEQGRAVAEGFPIEKTAERLMTVLHGLSGKGPVIKADAVSYVYIGKPQSSSSMELNLLGELSLTTFGRNHPVKRVNAEDPGQVSVHEVLQHAQEPVIAIAMDDTTFFAANWLPPLLDALHDGVELASPVCSDFFPVEMLYYSPRTLDDVAGKMSLKYRGEHRAWSPFPHLCYVVRKSSLVNLPPETPLSALPGKLKSSVVPASLTHRFGDYYSSNREDLLPFIPHGIEKVLEVGCAKGFLGELIKKERNCKVYGLEMNKEVADIAKTRMDDVFHQDIENASLPFDQDLDVILFPFILEHLFDPWKVLKDIRRWLKPDGLVVASLPNTAHYSIILDLLSGRWDYIPFGLLCITHIRFFTKATIEEMFVKAGYTLVTLEPQPFPAQFRDALFRMIGERIKDGHFSDEILHPGYYVVAKKVG